MPKQGRGKRRSSSMMEHIFGSCQFGTTTIHLGTNPSTSRTGASTSGPRSWPNNDQRRATLFVNLKVALEDCEKEVILQHLSSSGLRTLSNKLYRAKEDAGTQQEVLEETSSILLSQITAKLKNTSISPKIKENLGKARDVLKKMKRDFYEQVESRRVLQKVGGDDNEDEKDDEKDDEES
ncbi:uncharacterized protein LOC132204400 [Neocloeon triangulifer]|uniref:uncharacterized protein LOC132204400 n=1 Tax=Neocloeon triangulifer TaxID=2078957 RepID=UPI00286F9364|nr:uncharacterized protein LOC132204400 [Neocloeon triangulifer]